MGLVFVLFGPKPEGFASDHFASQSLTLLPAVPQQVLGQARARDKFGVAHEAGESGVGRDVFRPVVSLQMFLGKVGPGAAAFLAFPDQQFRMHLPLVLAHSASLLGRLWAKVALEALDFLGFVGGTKLSGRVGC